MSTDLQDFQFGAVVQAFDTLSDAEKRLNQLFSSDWKLAEGLSADKAHSLVDRDDWEDFCQEIMGTVDDFSHLHPIVARTHGFLILWGIEMRAMGYDVADCEIRLSDRGDILLIADGKSMRSTSWNLLNA